jgi:cysteinyl-tRNA synthetase
VKFVNLIKDGKESLNSEDLKLLRHTLEAFVFEVLGLENKSETEMDNSKLEGVVEMLIQMRNEARANKNWAMSDQIRDQLLAIGIQLKDGKEGTTFTI